MFSESHQKGKILQKHLEDTQKTGYSVESNKTNNTTLKNSTEEASKIKSFTVDVCYNLAELLRNSSPELFPEENEEANQKPSRWSELDLDKFQEPIRLISCPDKSSIPKLPKFELEKKNSEEPDTFQSLLKRIFRP